jgi:hypothetical protein
MLELCGVTSITGYLDLQSVDQMTLSGVIYKPILYIVKALKSNPLMWTPRITLSPWRNRSPYMLSTRQFTIECNESYSVFGRLEYEEQVAQPVM